MPTSSVILCGSSSSGDRGPKGRNAGKRGDARALKPRSGGAAQRVRQKTTRERRRSADGVRKSAERTCVGCNGAGDASELLRVVATPASSEQTQTSEHAVAERTIVGPLQVIVDLTGKLPGRGAWVHPQPNCLARACSRGFAKSFGAAVRTTPPELLEQIGNAAERRLSGLLLASLRSRQLVYGRDAVKEILGQAPLVIMASDAQAVAKDGQLQRAGLEGKVVIWSTKAQLGHWLGRSEVGVVAITEASIAEVMRKTIALAGLALEPRVPKAAGSGRLMSAAADDAAGEDADDAASQLEGDVATGSSASESGAAASGAAASSAVESSAVREEVSEVR